MNATLPRRLLGSLLLLAVMACSDPVAVRDGGMRVIPEGEAFTIQNHSRFLDLVVLFVDVRSAPLVDLAPCDEWPNPILPGDDLRVPYRDVVGFDGGTERAEVHWCFLHDETVVDGGTFRIELDR